MKTYILFSSCVQLIIDEKCIIIPIDTKNKDYMEYLKWVEEGNIAAHGVSQF